MAQGAAGCLGRNRIRDASGKIRGSLLFPTIIFRSQACLSGPDRRLGPIGHLQFAVNIGHVVAHGFQADRQTLRDGGVGFTASDQV